jgi:branched-chain amino acid transport system substrate-binding protein
VPAGLQKTSVFSSAFHPIFITAQFWNLQVITTMQLPNSSSQNIAVVIRFNEGSFEEGFSYRAEILEQGCMMRRYPAVGRRHNDTPYLKTPPVPQLPDLYHQWASKYAESGKARGTMREYEHESSGTRKIQVPESVITHFSAQLSECKYADQKLREYLLDTWFNNRGSFETLRNWILAESKIQKDESIPIIFEFSTGKFEQDYILRRLPWHLWELIRTDLYRNAEIALLADSFRRTSSLEAPVKILAIFGGDEGGLNLSEDQKTLQKLSASGAQIREIHHPSRAELLQILSHEPCDILFFAGHSYSDKEFRTGYLDLGNGNTCSLTELRPSLLYAVEHGLKLAIFNSCDGLGLADFLASIDLPFSVIFRESVPDAVAIQFLHTFLNHFSSGMPLYPALRQARKKLIEMEDEYPSASWLPIINQSQSQQELVWPVNQVKTPVKPRPGRPGFDTNSKKLSVLVGCIAAAGILGGAAYFVYRGLQPNYGSSLALAEASLGEDLLITAENLPYASCKENYSFKEEGVAAFKEKQWQTAIDAFTAFRKSCMSDPETLVYLNNARVFQTNPNPRDIIRVAAVVPIGNSDTVGAAQEILRGPAQAQDEINNMDGGIDGRPIQIQIVNDSSFEAQKAHDLTAKVADALAQDPAIVAAVGSFTSPATDMADDFYAEAGLVSVSPTSTAIRNTDDFSISEMVFRTAPTDAKAAQNLAEVIATSGYETVGIVYESNNSYSNSLKQQVGLELDGITEFISSEKCDLSSNQFSANTCVNSVFADAEAILLIPSTEISKDVEIISRNSLLDNPLPLLGGDAVFGYETLAEVGTDVEGMLVSVPWHQSTDIDNQASAFLDAAQTTWISNVNWRTALAYDAAQAIFGAINQINDRPTRQAIKSALLNGKFDGFLGDGTIEFNDGDRMLYDGLGLGTIVQVECAGEENASCNYVQPNL